MTILSEFIKEALPFDKEIGKYYKPNQKIIIFEIGSCEGEDTIRLRNRFPKAEIHSFEPLPSNVENNRKNCQRYGVDDVKLNQLALSNQDGYAKFYVSSGRPEDMPDDDWDYGNKSSSLLKPKKVKRTKWLKFKQKIDVPTKRLDTYCKENKIQKVDFIFLDVQGAELMVLEGAGEMVKNIMMIWLEVNSEEMYRKQPLKTDVEIFMEEHGFTRIKDAVSGGGGDQLYINSKLKKPATIETGANSKK